MSEWLRVTKKHPCPVCGRGDWCTYVSDDSYACCMRIMDGSVPLKSGALTLKNGGYLFKLTTDETRPLPRHVEKPIQEVKDFGELVYDCETKTSDRQLEEYAKTMNLPGWPLRLMRCGLYQGTMGFPMRNATGKFIGVRMRATNGQKWCIPGSRNGLFMAHSTYPDLNAEYGFIVEGGTNVIALLSVSVLSVGRPSNTAGLDMLVEYLRPSKRTLVICRDNDTKPTALQNTLRGAWLLARALIECKKRVKMVITPTKDCRDWVTGGAGKNALLLLANNAKTLTKEDCEKKLAEILSMREEILV